MPSHSSSPPTSPPFPTLLPLPPLSFSFPSIPFPILSSPYLSPSLQHHSYPIPTYPHTVCVLACVSAQISLPQCLLNCLWLRQMMCVYISICPQPRMPVSMSVCCPFMIVPFFIRPSVRLSI